MYKELELLIFPVQNKANPSSLCLPSRALLLLNFCVFMDPDEKGRIYFMVKREFFLAGQPREITSGQDVPNLPARVANHNRGFALSCPLANSVIL